MTAEIAIVNRSAVTLAADSAMTLSVRGRRKIYTSTDKIFELSEKDPIGIMIYNNLEFMGAPVDVIIKQFRKSANCKHFGSMRASAEAFFQYLCREWTPSEDQQKIHAGQILIQAYKAVRVSFDKKFRTLVQAKRRASSSMIHDAFILSITDSIERYEAHRISECFSDVSEDMIADFYRATFDDLINMVFNALPLDDSDRQLLRQLGTLALHRDVFSELLSGLVFAGFGDSEVFPSLLAFHLDGIIAGRLKTKVIEECCTSREQISAKIIPFAQREVVDRFLVGIDPQLEVGIGDYLRTSFERTQRSLFNGVHRLSANSKQKILDNLAASLGIAVKDFGPDWLDQTKRRYSQQTEDMMLFMAKQELANLAEALVNITSIKRKYSADEESVAGPIDVAVILRNDGFVWVKRKHYFPAELNHRYFVRKFGNVMERKGGCDA